MMIFLSMYITCFLPPTELHICFLVSSSITEGFPSQLQPGASSLLCHLLTLFHLLALSQKCTDSSCLLLLTSTAPYSCDSLCTALQEVKSGHQKESRHEFMNLFSIINQNLSGVNLYFALGTQLWNLLGFQESKVSILAQVNVFLFGYMCLTSRITLSYSL